MTRLLLLSCLFFITYASPAQAKKGFWEAILPGLFGDHIERQAKPEETLRAPFAYDPRNKNPEKLDGLPQNATPLHLPHRDEATIQDWVTTHVSGVLNYKAGNFAAQISERSQYFSQQGFESYKKFLKQYQIEKTLQSGKYKMSSFAQKTPLMLNDGAIGGHYSWSYEIPVMITYLDHRVESYEQVADPVNHAYLVNVQLIRVAEGGGPDGLVIQDFQAKPIKAK